MRLINIALLGILLFSACSTKYINKCPKRPELKTFKCDVKPVKFQKCVLKDNQVVICIDKDNASILRTNIKVLRECIRAYEKQIEIYSAF